MAEAYTTDEIAEIKEEAVRRRQARPRRGLYDKFRVERSDGRDEPRDRAARYFVLNYVGDTHARAAMAAYAASCRESYPKLADDIVEELVDSKRDFETFGLDHSC